MDFEREILSGIKKQCEEYIRENEKIYKETCIYLKYISYKDKAIEEIDFIKKCIDQFSFMEKTYKYKLQNYKIKDYLYNKYEKMKELEEEVEYISSKIQNLNFDMSIYKEYQMNENEIRRIDITLKELGIS